MEPHSFHRLPPRIPSNYHYFTNGIIWFFAGLNLVRLAFGWFSEEDFTKAILSGSVSIVLAIYITIARFSFIVGKFNSRIETLPTHSWVLTFQALKHYILLTFMMFLGIFLRKNSGISTYILALIYTTMGSVLIFSSYNFLRPFVNSLRKTDDIKIHG